MQFKHVQLLMKKAAILFVVLVGLYFSYKQTKKINFNRTFKVGQRIDSLNSVIVYYNGGVGNVEQRNTKDGYNLGLEYQCVEFVKRYYYEYYHHKMPDSYGHAVSFYDKTVEDGKINTQRNLTQYKNPSFSKPQVGDLIVMSGTPFNKYGHVAIISQVKDGEVEIIQQNPGPFSPSRKTFNLVKTTTARWKIDSERILGWLRK